MIARGPGRYLPKIIRTEKWMISTSNFSEIYNADGKRSTVKIFGSDISVQSCAIARQHQKRRAFQGD